MEYQFLLFFSSRNAEISNFNTAIMETRKAKENGYESNFDKGKD